MVPVESKLTALKGGLDIVTAATLVDPGLVIDAQNYEIDSINGGYVTTKGYERYDGRTSPSSAGYWVIGFSGTTPAVGATITGASSTHTAKVLAVVGSTLIIGRATGIFTSGESLGGGTTATSTAATSGESDVALHYSYISLAAADRRADIAAVPGSGSILGVVRYKGVLYAFRNNAGGTAAVMHKETASGWTTVTTPALAASGRFEFVIHNFTGSTDTRYLYGVDGKNKAFQFDGTTFTQITTGMPTDTPTHLAVHNNYLILSFRGSIQTSPIGNPTGTWTLTTGSTEIGVGDEITALLRQPGDVNTSVLHVFSKGSTHSLYGKTSADWKMVVDSPNTGGYAYTAQHMGAAFVLSERGIQNIQATDAFGDFQFSTTSGLIQPLINRLKGTAVASAAYKERNQYRVFYSDGYALAMTMLGTKSQGIMPLLYPNPVTCYWVDETDGGDEVCYFGSTNGFVYQDNIGTSFDGDDIEAWIRLPFNHLGSPRYRKRFRRMILDMTVQAYSSLQIGYELGCGTNTVNPGVTQTATTYGGGGYWDSFTWDSFTWDAQPINQPSLDLTGTEKNLSVLAYSKSSVYSQVSIQAITFNYSVRRLER